MRKNNDVSKRRPLLPLKLNERSRKKKRHFSLLGGNVKRNVLPLSRKLDYSNNGKRTQKHAGKLAKRQKRQPPYGSLSLPHPPSVQMAETQVGGGTLLQTQFLLPPLALRTRLSLHSGPRAPVPPLCQNISRELCREVVGEPGKRLKPRKRQPQCLPESQERHPLALAHPRFLQRKTPKLMMMVSRPWTREVVFGVLDGDGLSFSLGSPSRLFCFRVYYA